MSVRAAADLDLSEPRHSGELIGLALDLFRRHAGLFLSVTSLCFFQRRPLD